MNRYQALVDDGRRCRRCGRRAQLFDSRDPSTGWEGWCRVWRHLPGRAHATLSVMPEPGTQIAGLIASVKSDDWAALDAREAAYTRHDVSGVVVHGGPEAAEIAMYVVPFGADAPALAPIQLSYLDVVVQGYDAVLARRVWRISSQRRAAGRRLFWMTGPRRFIRAIRSWHRNNWLLWMP